MWHFCQPKKKKKKKRHLHIFSSNICPDSFNNMCNCTVHYERVQFLVCTSKCVFVCVRPPLLRQGFLEGPKLPPPCPWSNKESSAIQRHYKLPQPPATSTKEFNLSPHTHSQVPYWDSTTEIVRLWETVHLICLVALLSLLAKLPWCRYHFLFYKHTEI